MTYNTKNVQIMALAFIMVTSMTSAAYADNDAASSITAGAIPTSLIPMSIAEECKEIDLVFIVDDTGSMGGTLENIKSELVNIVAQADLGDASGEARLGLVTFKDNVTVVDTLSTNRTTSLAAINALTSGGGTGSPEASNEAKNTVVNSLDFDPILRPEQIGDFAPLPADNWGGVDTTKIAILITDAPPGGFDDNDDASDYTDMTTYGAMAFTNDILVSDILVGTIFDDDPLVLDAMASDASAAGGSFVINAAGDNVAGAIIEIIAACGGDITDETVAGELLSINSSALFINGLSSMSMWMIPALAGFAGTGLFLVKYKSNRV